MEILQIGNNKQQGRNGLFWNVTPKLCRNWGLLCETWDSFLNKQFIVSFLHTGDSLMAGYESVSAATIRKWHFVRDADNWTYKMLMEK